MAGVCRRSRPSWTEHAQQSVQYNSFEQNSPQEMMTILKRERGWKSLLNQRNRTDLIMEIETLVKMVAREVLPPATLMFSLLWYARNDRLGFDILLAAIKSEDLFWVADVLATYPQTEIGWTILPVSRKPYQRPDLDRYESEDVDRRQYQEDRTHVEFLRERIRQRAFE